MARQPSRPPTRATGLLARLRPWVILVLVAAALSLSASSVWAEPAPAPGPTATPSPQVSWIAPPPPPASADGCGWMDVGCKINRAMNGWFTSLVVEAINPAFVAVGRTLLSSPPPSMLARVHELSGHVRLVANTLLVLFVLAGGVIVMAYGSTQTSTTAQEIVQRLVMATIAVNASLAVCEYAVHLANALVAALLGEGVDGIRAGNLIAGKVNALITDPQSTLLFLVLMIGAAVLMGILLAFIAIIRIALLLFLIISAPLALLFHALPQTEGIARLWWRCFTGVLAIQVLQALGLILAFKLFLTDSTDAFAPPTPGSGGGAAGLVAVQPTASRAVDALILIGVLFILIKIPGWVARTIWQQAQPALLKRLIKAVIVYKTLGAVRHTLGRARHSPATRTPKTTTTHRHSRRPPRGPAGGGPAGRGPKPTRPPSTPGGPCVTPSPSASGPQQLALPFTIPPAAKPQGTGSSAPPTRAKTARGHQLALPFPVTRLPRPPASPLPPPPTGPWIRPRPPWIQDRLPSMPTRRPRPGQLRLRLDPPPRRTPRNRREPRTDSR